MGCCIAKRHAKVNSLSNGELVCPDLQGQNSTNTHENVEEETSNKCVEITKTTSVDKNITNWIFPADILKPKAVTFDINFKDTSISSRLAPQKFPRRLKKLEGMPQLTAEQLRRKQELAEQKRTKELQRKTETMSKYHRDLFQAREFERLQNAQMQMEQKFLASERNRENHVKCVVSKQQMREEKAKKVREKCFIEREGSVVHVDETYSSASSSAEGGWPGDEEYERPGEELQDDSSMDEFYDTGGRIHLNKKTTNTLTDLVCI